MPNNKFGLGWVRSYKSLTKFMLELRRRITRWQSCILFYRVPIADFLAAQCSKNMILITLLIRQGVQIAAAYSTPVEREDESEADHTMRSPQRWEPYGCG